MKAKTLGSRRSVPAHTRQLVLLEAGYMCANPRCRHILTLELHHIIWVRDGGGNDPANLIALCPNCHSLHTLGHIPKEAVRVWKAMLVSLNGVNRASIDVLIHLHRMEQRSYGKNIRYFWRLSTLSC
ncbi:MAG: HNH endonuclease [Burkholderiales bacterium]